MGKIALSLLLAFATQLSAESIIFDDMKEHKRAFLAEIISDPQKVDPYYPLMRVTLTINADDADYIPKVPDAGKVFEEEGIRYQLMHNGIKILEHSYYAAWMTDVIYALRGHHEPQEEKVFYEVLKYIPSNATMIELGSYWGYYSLWFSKMVEGAKNFLIEPEIENMELGKKHFALNGKGAHFTLGYVLLRPTDPESYPFAKRICVDDFIKENQIEHVNILHADIQWAEYQMLLTCQEAIKKEQIDYFFISTHDPLVHSNCRNLLLEANYLIIAEHKVEESCSVDGLIVARRKGVAGPTHISVRKYP
jgi:hypothetical protein